MLQKIEVNRQKFKKQTKNAPNMAPKGRRACSSTGRDAPSGGRSPAQEGLVGDSLGMNLTRWGSDPCAL